MATEIERKFLVIGNSWKTDCGIQVSQGYLNLDKNRTVRVRLAGATAFLTIKGMTTGATRPEFEYQITAVDAQEMLKLCVGHLIEKTRHKVSYAGMNWEIDEFHGANAGLVVAEIELQSEDQSFAKPAWLGPEVTQDSRYFNSSLAVSPFSHWPWTEK